MIVRSGRLTFSGAVESATKRRRRKQKRRKNKKLYIIIIINDIMFSFGTDNTNNSNNSVSTATIYESLSCGAAEEKRHYYSKLYILRTQ